MAFALLARPSGESESPLRREALPTRPPDAAPVRVASFEEGWNFLERLGRRDDYLSYALQLKYCAASVGNLLRICETAALPDDKSSLKPEVRAQQRAFALKQAEETLAAARAVVVGAPAALEGRYVMSEVVAAFTLVKARAEHGAPAEARAIFGRALGKLVSELPQ